MDALDDSQELHALFRELPFTSTATGQLDN